jgi:hypothetical protein
VSTSPPIPASDPGEELGILPGQLVLEEYRTLREEVQNALQAQHAALSYGIASLAIFTAAIVNTWERAPLLTAVALMGGLPIGSAFVLLLWTIEVIRMQRAGTYLGRYVEPRINRMMRRTLGEGDFLVYEQWLAGVTPPRRRLAKSRSLRHGHVLIAFLVAFVAVGCFWIGSARFDTLAITARRCAQTIEVDPLCPKYQNDQARANTKKKTRAPYYYRDWHRQWQFWGEREFGLVVFGFLIVPFCFGVIISAQYVRNYGPSDLPDLAGINSPSRQVAADEPSDVSQAPS